MNYAVRWLPTAEEELTTLWLNSANRSRVTQAAHRLDLQLQHNPAQLGESRPDGLRIHFAPPLGALFRVQAAPQIVEVVHVWEFEV
jgi:hypothetical protein